jgi:hypothetical protein
MSTMTIEELKEQLALLPDQFRQALARETEATFKANRLETSVEKLRERLKSQNKEEDEDEPEEDGEGDDVELIKLESAQDRLKVKLQGEEYKAEMAFRRDFPKATNEHVKAAVGNTPEVERLRLKLIDAKEECKLKEITLQRARREAANARAEARRELWVRRRDRPEPESKELDKLEEEYAEALRMMMEAKDEVEILRAKLDTFKVLVQLESI